MDDELQTLIRIALAQDGLFFGLLSAFLAAKAWVCYRSNAHALSQLKRTPSTEISDLPKLLNSPANSSGARQGSLQEPSPAGDAAANPNLNSKSLNSKPSNGGNTSSSWRGALLGTPQIFSSEKNAVSDLGSRMMLRNIAGVPTPASELGPGNQQSPGNAFSLSRRWTFPNWSILKEWRASGRRRGIERKKEQQQLVVVRGKVQPMDLEKPKSHAEGLKSEHCTERGVYVEKSQTYVYAEKRGLFGWMTQKEQVSVTKTSVPFVLAENKWPVGHVVRVYMEGSRHSVPLQCVYSHMNPAEPSWNRTALHALFGHRLPVGLIHEEKILKVGTDITAVGHLDRTPEGLPIIRAAKNMPLFMTGLTREEIIGHVAQNCRLLFWGSVAVTTVAVGVISYSCFKNWRRWKDEFQRARRNNSASAARLRNAAALVDEEEGERGEDGAPPRDGELCVVCLTRRRRAVFVHCGHRVCCASCARCIQESATPRCPICREEVASVYRVFDS